MSAVSLVLKELVEFRATCMEACSPVLHTEEPLVFRLKSFMQNYIIPNSSQKISLGIRVKLPAGYTGVLRRYPLEATDVPSSIQEKPVGAVIYANQFYLDLYITNNSCINSLYIREGQILAELEILPVDTLKARHSRKFQQEIQDFFFQNFDIENIQELYPVDPFHDIGKEPLSDSDVDIEEL